MSKQDAIIKISSKEYWEDIKNDYLSKLANKAGDEIYPSPNPGPTLPNGGVNFECHCVGHLVGSPCGYQFRQAISCQKVSTEEQMMEGACGKELLSFMECATRTQCFASTNTTEKKN